MKSKKILFPVSEHFWTGKKCNLFDCLPFGATGLMGPVPVTVGQVWKKWIQMKNKTFYNMLELTSAVDINEAAKN